MLIDVKAGSARTHARTAAAFAPSAQQVFPVRGEEGGGEIGCFIHW